MNSHRMRFHTAILINLCILLAPLAVSYAGFQEDYDKALETFRGAKVKADYEDAARQFSTLSNRKDSGNLHANTIFWLAESYYGLKDYARALNWFERVLLVPRSNKEEDARYKVAACYLRLGWHEAARWELSRFLRDFPNSSKVGLVRKELDKLPPGAKGN